MIRDTRAPAGRLSRAVLATTTVALLAFTGSPTSAAESSPLPATTVSSGSCPAGHVVATTSVAREATPSPDATAAPVLKGPPPSDGVATAPTPEATPTDISLGGGWSKLPRSPFAAVDPVAVWADDQLVVVDHMSGRTATYDPAIRRWEEHQAVPGEPEPEGTGWAFEGSAQATWTGSEVIVSGTRLGPDAAWRAWYAFDPVAGRWRDVAPWPLESWTGGPTTWSGQLLLAVRGRTAAAYDPAADCWLAMPEVPLPALPETARTARVDDWAVRSIHWTGHELLAVVVRVEEDGAAGIVSFDPSTWTWTPGPLGPIDGDLVDPLLAEGLLWFIGDEPGDARGGLTTNATYDPSADTWARLDTDCRIDTGRAAWTGRLIMEPYRDRRAFDPATGACYRIPASKDRAREWAPVWTGREFVYWSGAYGDTSNARRDGIVYRPPRKAITAEPAKPIGKKLKRAIVARRDHGFETDPEVVRAIIQDPSCRARGMPLTQEECEDVNDRSWFSSQLQEEVIPYLKRRPTKGGWWFDHRHGGRLVVALTEADPKAIARIDALMPTEPDLGWRLVIVERPLKDLRQAQWRAPKVSERIDPTAKLWGWGVDVRDGVVTLMYDPDDVKRMRAKKQELEKRLGVPVRITSGRVTDL